MNTRIYNLTEIIFSHTTKSSLALTLLVLMIAVLANVFEFSLLSGALGFAFIGCGSGCSCTDDGGADGSSGCGSDDGVTSTPYLYIERNGKMEILNDVMIGHPFTFFTDRNEGVASMSTQSVGTDIFPIRLNKSDYKNTIKLQLKELEPEESFVYSLKNAFVTVPKGKRLLQDWTHHNLFSVPQTQPLQTEVLKSTGEKCDAVFEQNLGKKLPHTEQKSASIQLQRDESLTFSINTKQGTSSRLKYFTVASFWKNMSEVDFTTMHTNVRAYQTRKSSLTEVFGKVSALVALFTGMVWGAGATNPASETVSDQNGLQEFMKLSNLVPTAHADSPHTSKCLNISYLHPNLGYYVHYATVQPRAYNSEDILVEIPSESLNKEGIASIQIEATREHYVYALGLVHGNVEKVEVAGLTEIEGVLNGKTSVTPTTASPLHTVAGDSFTFEVDAPRNAETHLIVALQGFYTGLSAEGAERAGNWESKLTPEEKAIFNIETTSV